MSNSVLEPPQVDELYRGLEEKVRALRPRDDLSALDRAYRFAAEHHKNQKRKSGEPYISHPLAVAHILADMQMDLVSIETGLLHDAVEDTNAKMEEIKEKFGDDVARCVDGVTKLSKISFANREDRQAESLRKMLLAMTGDIRVIIVKLADRLHNMRTIGSLRSREAGGDRSGNARHLRAHRSPAWDGQGARRIGRFVLCHPAA